MNTEPIRISVGLAAIVSAVILGLLGWLETGDWRAGVVAGLTALLPIFGGEAARLKAWAPRSVDGVLDAETVIAAEQRRDG